jgi:hypothetical protein
MYTLSMLLYDLAVAGYAKAFDCGAALQLMYGIVYVVKCSIQEATYRHHHVAPMAQNESDQYLQKAQQVHSVCA